MDSPTYIANAIRTESVPESIDINQVGLAAVLSIGILASQIVDLVKKKIFYGKQIDQGQLAMTCAKLATGAGMMAKETMEGADMNAVMSDSDIEATGGDDYMHNVKHLNVRALHAALGCFTESGELLEALVKQLTTGTLDLVNFGEEIGDIEWYQAIGFDVTGVTEASCREKNIAKLRKRYPEKFDAGQAVNRDIEAERKILEWDSPEARAARGEDANGNDALGEDQ